MKAELLIDGFVWGLLASGMFGAGVQHGMAVAVEGVSYRCAPGDGFLDTLGHTSYPSLGDRIMQSELSGPQASRLVLRIVAWALGIGGVSFAAGFLGPMFFSNPRAANVGPLLGFLVTGPLGTLVGAWVGALIVAKESVRLSIACIGSVWIMALIYTCKAFGLGGWLGIPAIPLQLLVVASILLLLSRRATRAQLPDDMRRCGPIAVTALLIILLMTLFPPVMRPWWVPAGQQPVTTVQLPSFAFIFDDRFDTSRLPKLAVNTGKLEAEWLITSVVAIGLCLLMRVLRHRPTV